MQQLFFVTGNKNKVREVESILGFKLKTLTADLDEIQTLNLEEIATKKAQQAFELLKKPLLVEDAGLFTKSLNGFPGPFVRHVLDAGGNQLILKMLGGINDRHATARAVFAFHDGEKTHTFLGEVEGEISKEQKGESWGWDPIFIPKGSNQTYAQMGEEKKNLLSHRRAALAKLKEFLETVK